MDKSLVTVVVPTRNRPNETLACAQSIRAQTYPNIELIVVDGNSTDNTRDLITPITDQIIIFPEPGDHRCAQRNLGVNNAKGEYVLIIDSDMTLSPGVIKSCVKIMQASHIRGIIIPEESFGNGFWAQCKKLEKSFYTGIDSIEAARFFRKKDFVAIGGYDEDLTSGEDWDLSDRMELLGTLAHTNAPIYHNEGKISLLQTLKKKFYYAQKARVYIAHTKEIPTARKRRLGVMGRYIIFLKHPWKLFRNPTLGAGMLFMKSCELGVGCVGYLLAKLK